MNTNNRIDASNNVFPRDIVCLRNTSTLHKGDDDDNDDDNNNNNNNNNTVEIRMCYNKKELLQMHTGQFTTSLSLAKANSYQMLYTKCISG